MSDWFLAGWENKQNKQKPISGINDDAKPRSFGVKMGSTVLVLESKEFWWVFQKVSLSYNRPFLQIYLESPNHGGSETTVITHC